MWCKYGHVTPPTTGVWWQVFCGVSHSAALGFDQDANLRCVFCTPFSLGNSRLQGYLT